jgi:heme exporter protein A
MLELHVESLSKRYGPRRVLEDLSFTARAGSVLVVTGPNGAGKSTLLRCLAGLERPGRGRVRFRDGEHEWPRVERRHRLGFLSPELALYEELTGRENLDFFALMKGLNPCAAGIGELLERVGLGARGRDRVGDYSSGMRQRLKWAFALLGDPAALLLDEPGVTLDAEGFATAAALVDRARARGRLIVLATNDTRELELGDERLSLG